MNHIPKILKVSAALGFTLLGIQAHAQATQVAEAAAAAPSAISGMAKAIEAITVTKMATDTVQSISNAAGTGNKDIAPSLNGAGDPKIFYASYLPVDSKNSIELTEGWKPRQLQCEMHYMDPNFGNTVNNLKLSLLKGIWPTAAVSFYYTIDFQYGGSYKGTGHYVNDLSIRELGQHNTPGWHFTVTPSKLPALQLGTVDDPIIAFRVSMQFTVQNEIAGVTLLKDIHEDVSTFSGDGTVSHPKKTQGELANRSNFVNKCILLSDEHLKDETEIDQPE